MVTLHMKDARDYLALRGVELRDELQNRDTAVMAANTGSSFTAREPGQGEFRLPFWGQETILTWPDFKGYDARSGAALPTFNLAMLAYYFHISDGTPPARTWISFTELPGGKFYAAAFQGYTGNELSKVFGNDLPVFAATAELAGGRQESFGDAAYAFKALPKVRLLVVAWQGDEDFPPSYRILFDGHSSHHMSTDACAILGSTLTQRLIKSRAEN
jgi:hypothetical protein